MRKNVYLIFLMLFTSAPLCTKAGELIYVKSIPVGIAYCVYADSQYAYVTNNDGLVIVDLKYQAQIGKIDVGASFGVAIKNNLAFISCEEGIIAADISDPGNIRELCKYKLNSVSHRIYLKENTLFAACNSGMEILDISNPHQIISLSHYGNNSLSDIGISSGIAYLADYQKGIEVVDVSNPAQPKYVTSLDNTIGAWDVHAYNEYLYIGRHGNGISIFNIIDPESPKHLGNYIDDDGGEAQGVCTYGKYLYVADNCCIEILDITNPSGPNEIAEYSNVSGAHDICFQDGYIYAATGDKGLLILKYE